MNIHLNARPLFYLLANRYSCGGGNSSAFVQKGLSGERENKSGADRANGGQRAPRLSAAINLKAIQRFKSCLD